jgi:zinc transporter
MDQSVGRTYGSDKDGLVWGYLFEAGAPAVDIESDGAARFLADEHAPAGSFVWLNFSLSNVAAERWIARHLAPPPAYTESLRGDDGSTRIELDEGALVAVIHDVQFEFSWDPANISTVSLCAEPRFLVTARLKPLRSVDRLRDTVRAGNRFRSSGDLFAQLLRQQADVMVDIVRNATRRVDEIEDKLLARNLTTSRKELGALRGLLVRMQRLLAPEPAAMFRLLSRPPQWITDEDLQDLRQAAEEFSSAVTDSGALVDRLKQLQEELVAQINEQTGRTLFVLTIVTVLALPVNLVAGLFGMNVGGVPLAQSSHGFLAVVASLITLTALLAYVAFRGRR